MVISQLYTQRWFRYVVVTVLLALMAVMQIASMVQENQTIDEGVHLAGGVSYWLSGDFRINEEHPPLIKLIAGLGVLLIKPNVPFTSPAWTSANEWAFANQLLYHSGNDADRILLFARLPMVLVTLGLGLLIWYVARKIAGDLAGLLALGWYVFDPNFLAHGPLVTTDVGAAFGFLATLVVLLILLEQWSRGRLIAFGIVFALAQMTKYSLVFLWLLIIALPVIWYIAHRQEFIPAKVIIKRTAAIFGIALFSFVIITFAMYFGQVAYGHDDQRIKELFVERQKIIDAGTLDQQLPLLQKVIELSDESTPFERLASRIVLDTPIPAWSYFKGLVKVISHNAGGHLAYLMGRYSTTGWWWYFPIAFIVKTPLVTLLVFSAACVAALTRWGKQHLRFEKRWLWVLTLAAALYFVWSMTSKINLGVRHIFPVYPVIFIAIGAFLSVLWTQHGKSFRTGLTVLCVVYTVASILAFPTYLAYFSELVGTTHGPKYLVDSNIDWGQDVKRLKAYMDEHAIPYVCMSYFGQADLVYYGIDYRYLPTGADPHEPQDVNCVVAISVTSLLSQDGVYWWLLEHEPDERIGETIYVYDLRKEVL